MLRTLFLCTALAAALVGCKGPSYVNIPAQQGDLAVNDPNSDIVRQVVAEAISGLLRQTPLDAPVAVTLPEGSTVLTHADIARRLGDQAVSPYDEGVEAATRIEVRQIRIRANYAEVDAVVPGRGGVSQLQTVYLDWAPFGGGWGATRVRTWRAGAEQVLFQEEANAPTQVP